jgi:hypothetical protein
MARRLKVFVSYSRHENETDRVSAICEWLRDLGDGDIDFIMDRSLRAGDSLEDFERSAGSYRAALIIGTRKYREKVLAGDCGVAREHAILMKAYESNSLSLFTVVTESRFDLVFPDDMKHVIATDLSGLLFDSEHRVISNHSRAIFKPQAMALVTDLLACRRQTTYSRSSVATIRQKLFFENKQEVISPDLDNEILKKIFIKTSYYNAVINKASYVLIGRKGSGKSFLTDYFSRFPIDNNTIPVLIHFREFKLSNVYLMGTTSSLAQDAGGVLSEAELFECAWCLVFTMASLLQTFIEVKEHRLEYDLHRIRRIEELADQSGCVDIDFLTGKRSISIQRLMDWSTEKVFDFVSQGIDGLSGDYAKAISSIQSLTSPKVVVTSVIGIGVLNQFSEVCRVLAPTFLIAIDGFDSKFDNFRRETNSVAYKHDDRARRVSFEVNWLKGLLEATQTVINPPIGQRLVSQNASYRLLVTLPRDRFVEVQASDRDAFRFRHKYVEIRWSGPELMNLIRKRLEAYYNRSCKPGEVNAKLAEAMEWICNISDNIRFQYNGKLIDIDVFSYFLGHSFWRPRDLLYHVSLLIEIGQQYRKIGRRITVEKIREIARLGSLDIINQEFIGEFESIFPSIREFMARFYEQPIEMTYDRLFSIVQAADVRLSSGEYLETLEKVDFLYEIGFLGIVVDDPRRRGVGFRRREAFSFSDSVDGYRLLSSESKVRAKWVIHPIFSEYLQLDTADAPFLLSYDADYLTAGD